MSAATIWDALQLTLADIDGLHAVVLGEPTATHDLPCLYVAYQGFTRPLRNTPPARNLTGMIHSFVLRLVIRWQDREIAEAQLLALLDAIPDAIDDDPRFGNTITKGLGYIDAGTTGYQEIGGTTYRIVDYTLTVLEKIQR